MDEAEGFKVVVSWMLVDHHVNNVSPSVEIESMGGSQEGWDVDEMKNLGCLYVKGDYGPRQKIVEFASSIIMCSDESRV